MLNLAEVSVAGPGFNMLQHFTEYLQLSQRVLDAGDSLKWHKNQARDDLGQFWLNNMPMVLHVEENARDFYEGSLVSKWFGLGPRM